jgi:hypothetical protein
MTEPRRRDRRQEQEEELPLSKSVQYLLEECRMVLPGIQALFGFQLIAVLNPAFTERFDAAQQRLHLVALGLVAVAIALIMTPAAYHRQTGPREVTESFIVLSTRLVLWSMLPLAVGICLDFYLVGFVVLRSHWVAALAAALFALFVGLWFVLPRSQRLRALVAQP